MVRSGSSSFSGDSRSPRSPTAQPASHHETKHEPSMWWPPNWRQREVAVAVICVAIFLLFADQNLLAPNLTAAANEFGFTERERDTKLGGNIALAFFLVGAPVAVVSGYLADVWPRVRLLSVIIGFGALACAMTALTATYEQLFICRMLTGIGVGGATPVVFSLLGDMFAGGTRLQASTLVGLSLGAGIALGQLLAGVTGPTWGWRAPFLVIGIPAFCWSIVIAIVVDEPVFGSQERAVQDLSSSIQSVTPNNRHESGEFTFTRSENVVNPLISTDSLQQTFGPSSVSAAWITYDSVEHGVNNPRWLGAVPYNSLPANDANRRTSNDSISYGERISWTAVKRLLSTPSVLLILLQGLPGCLPWGMVYAFLSDFFSADRGLSVAEATFTLTAFGVGGLIGQAGGGWLGHKLYNIDMRLQCLMMGMSTIASVPLMIFLINTSYVGHTFFYFVAVLTGIVVSVNGPNVRVILQNVCAPETRGTAFAIFTVTDDIGKGLGPALVVTLINAFGGDRQIAFSVVVCFWIPCGVCLLALIFTAPCDEEAVNRHVKESILRSVGSLPALESTALEDTKLRSPTVIVDRVQS